MRLRHLSVLSAAVMCLSNAMPSVAQATDWTPRCRLSLADDNKPEYGKYFFQTRGKSDGAEARAQLDYNSGVSARAAAYPASGQDLLNPYSNVSLGVTYFTPGAGKGKVEVGVVRFGAIGKDFSAIPGGAITMKLVLDGVAFGPYPTGPVSTGMYSVWLDTATTDGDGKPPTLQPSEFGKLAKAIDAMKTAEVILVQDGVDIVRASLPTPQLAGWREGLATWATRTHTGVGAATSCGGGGDILQ